MILKGKKFRIFLILRVCNPKAKQLWLQTDRVSPETKAPPVFGKGEKVIRYKKILLILVFSNLLAFVYPLGVYLNGELFALYTSSQLKTLSYSIPAGDNFVKGITLNELSPLLVDAYRIKVISGKGSYTFNNDNTAELLSSWYVYTSVNNTLSLTINGKTFNNVKSVYLYGSAIPVNSSLVFWVSWEGVNLLKREVQRFAKLHKVHIKVTEVPRIESKLLSVVRGGGAEPDIIMVQSDYLPSLTAVRAIQNLNFMLPLLCKKGIYAFTSDRRIWAAPFYFDTQLIFYNKKLVHQLLPETITLSQLTLSQLTLSQLEKIGNSLKDKGYIPFSWNVYSAYWLLPFQAGFGKQLNSTETRGYKSNTISPIARINDASTEEAVLYLNELINQKLLRPMERDAMISLFTSDRVGFILSGSYSIPDFDSIGLKFGVLPFPFNDKTDMPVPPLLDFKGLAITKRTKHPVLAKRLIQYLTGIGVQGRFPLSLSKMPANLKAWKIIKNNNNLYSVFLKSYKTGITIPPSQQYKIYKNTMWKLLRFIFSGKMSAHDALAKGQQIINRNLKNIRSSQR